MQTTRRLAPTLHDVAGRVGVSPRTVSRVVNDQGGFSEATRERVLAAVAELGYRPNQMARGLITQQSNTLAFLVPVLSDPFFPEVAEGIHHAARDAGLTMLFAMSGGDAATQTTVLSELEAHSPVGVIVFPSGQDVSLLTPFLERGMRMVCVDTPIDHPNASAVLSDLRAGTKLAVERMLRRGCRQLAMISSSVTPPNQRRRQDAFVDSLPEGMEPLVEIVEPTGKGGRSAMAELLERNPAIDGVFAYNDVMAVGAMQTLHSLGKRIPDDVAVIGCDDIATSAVVTPSLTTIRIDRELLGQSAVQMLRDLDADRLAQSSIVLPVELIVRDSG
ncbi:MAG: LacI family DNA-binding transcriptional regulator [Ilumatobacter sp.]|uniref:LacI family DNA-binding transcriptional regulator n=1 Tax=Ilumatobacter sp. TaxID=1967498 RepID=UPI003C78BFC5